MLKEFSITPQSYQTTQPYPHYYMDDCLDATVASELQKEILNIPDTEFDRYDNPFEQKYTLRDKYNYPKNLQLLLNYLTSEEFVQKLSVFVGHNLINDPNRNFWGVHKYERGDYLDIHVDAGIHPENKLKKQVTLGIYLSYNWKEECGCELEIWSGDSSADPNAKIYDCVKKIAPMFNRLILFSCDDNSWHGNPNPVLYSNVNICENDARRIFVTLSYLSDNKDFKNNRPKAFFVPRPNDLFDKEKDKLRILRADPEKYVDVYRYNKINK
jgi:hypothetical protein